MAERASVFSSLRKSSREICNASGPSAAARSGSCALHSMRPKMADVVVNQQALVELENGARVGAGFGIEQKFSGHAQVDHQYALIERENDKLAVPRHGFHKLIPNALA